MFQIRLLYSISSSFNLLFCFLILRLRRSARHLFWSGGKAPDDTANPEIMDFLGLIRVVDLAFCDDIYSCLAERWISSNLDHQPLWTVVHYSERVVWQVHSRFVSCQSFFQEYPAIKSWSGYFCDFMDKVTHRSPSWRGRFCTVSAMTASSHDYQLIDFFHISRDKGSLQVGNRVW